MNIKDQIQNYVEMLKELMAAGKDMVIVTGIAENQNEYMNLFDEVFLLKCKPETFIHRLMNRKTDNLFGKNPTEQEFLLHFYQKFEKDLVDSGAIAINAENAIDTVVADILSKYNFSCQA